jgi:hypothetical protein
MPTLILSGPEPELIEDTIDRNTVALTSAQGGFEWHVIRAGSSIVTSTIAYEVLMHFRNEATAEETILFSSIGLSLSEPTDFAGLDRDALRTKTTSQLKQLLRERALPQSGNKEALIERLLQAPNQPVSVIKKLMSKWFMKPLNNSFLKLGSANEIKILQALPAFFQHFGGGIALVSGPFQRGLLQRNTGSALSFLSTSIDGCAVLSAGLEDNSTEFAVVLELKTATTLNTQSEASRRLASAQALSRDPNMQVFRSDFGDDLCKLLVWTPQYRSQILHHTVTTSVSYCLFVVASLSKILYSVLVDIPAGVRSIYENFMIRLAYPALQEFSASPASFLESSDDFGHAVDIETLHIWQKMAKAIRNWPLRPAASDILPYCVSKWNHCKGGQDVCSRILKNVKVDFRKLTPRAFIYIRIIMTALMNGHMLYRLLEIEPELSNFSSYRQLKRALNHRRTFWEFLRDFIELWEPSLSFIRRQSDVAMMSQVNEQEPVERNRDPANLPKPPKRNILKWLQTDDGKKLRLSAEPHHRGSRKQRFCPLCKTHTTVYCKTCDINVCAQLALGTRKTCWDKLHTSQNLVPVAKTVRTGEKGRRGRSNSLEL